MTHVKIDADLVLDLDGTRARLTGSGDRLELRTDDPGALLSAVAGAGLPAGVGRVAGARALGRLAGLAREAGIRVDVIGPRGVLVSLGYGVRSAVGRLITGSSALRPAGPRAVGPLVMSQLTSRPVALGAAVVTVLAGVTARIVRRSTERKRPRPDQGSIPRG